MKRLAILDDYQGAALDLADWSALTGRCSIDVLRHNLAVPEPAASRLAPYHILCTMRERMPLPAALLERLPLLEMLVVTGARNRLLDLEAATRRGILVCNTGSGGGEHATAELAWGLILAGARHIAAEDRGMRAGAWQTTLGTTLHAKTLGLLGLGRIGKQMAALGRAFGMRVVAWSPNLTEARAAEGGAERVDKSALFAASDIVSLHLVLSERSRGIVGAAELGLMKPSAILVNTSRGPLIDEAALIETLRARRIAGAAIDVYEPEPLPADHPLRRLDNTVLTPHLGYVTGETFRGFFRDTVENVHGYLDGAPLRALNPEALDLRRS
jgi:phosphoglycerate dehydrogenase-like enzyme